MTALLLYYFIFVTFAIGFGLIIFKFFGAFLAWVADLIKEITK